MPHHLGVLSHFRGAVWYQGDNRLTQDPEDEVTETYFGDLPDASVAEREQYLTLAVRDFLNEGGKLVHTGETATYYGTLGNALGGIYYGLNGDPTAPCEVTDDPFGDCLLLADDFAQYYLGALQPRTPPTAPPGSPAPAPLSGSTAARSAARRSRPTRSTRPASSPATSTVLPAEEFPQFASSHGRALHRAPAGRFDPVEGELVRRRAPRRRLLHAADPRTVDLDRGDRGRRRPTLQAQLSYDTEEGYDNVIVEAHTVGQDDWTTLPEAGGLTSTAVPTECEAGFLLDEHPFLQPLPDARATPARRPGPPGRGTR